MHAVRRWSVRRARSMERLYALLERALVALHPLFEAIGYARLDRPVAFVERHLKGFFFDCKMCGHCVLSSTGMSCPMNCPKQLRNGPCGGVRANGNCEVEPAMRCVWVEAAAGAARMRAGREAILTVQAPVDARLRGTSSWLRVARDQGVEAAAARAHAGPG